MINPGTSKTPLICGLKVITFWQIQLAALFKFKCRAQFKSLLKTNGEKPTEEKKELFLSPVDFKTNPNLQRFTFKVQTNGYNSKAFGRSRIVLMSFLHFLGSDLWVCSVQLPLSVLSAMSFCSLNVQKLFAKNSSRRKYIKFQLRHLSRF